LVGAQKVRELIEQGKRLGKANLANLANLANQANQARAPEILESSKEDRAPMGSAGLNAGGGEKQ
jgi:hypothetical protein